MYRFIFLLLLAVSVSFLSNAQEVVSTERLGSRSSAELNVGLILLGSPVRVDYDVELVRLEYTTIGSDGEADVASGLIIYPKDFDGDLPLHVHAHGTTVKSAVPSTLGGGYELGLFYAASGHFVVMPDFLGMGTSRGFHPYVHKGTQASASWDMLLAAETYAQSNDDISVSKDLSIAGYSQGGHAAMAFQELVETSNKGVFNLYASTPMSGPYDLSGAFRDFLLSNEEYFFPGYLIYQLVGYNTVYGNFYDELSEVMKEPYLAAAQEFSMTGEDLGDLNQELSAILVENEGKSIPILMFKDEIVEQLSNDPEYVLNVWLRENNTYNFTAEAPTRLIYCTADDQVPFMNSVVADSIMNAKGANNTSSIDIDPTADHGGCVAPAVEESLKFIAQFLQSTSTYDILKEDVKVSVYPNPSQGLINIELKNDVSLESINIYNVNAQLIGTQNRIQKSQHRLDLSAYSPGTYVLEILTDKGSSFQKVIKSN